MWVVFQKIGNREEIIKTESSIILSDSSIITVHYHERSPYYITTKNGVEGLIATPVASAFNKAEIPFIWQKTPSKRQLQLIQYNKGKHAILGWFKNAERESFGKFSHFVYQDKPYIAIARADNNNIKNNMDVESILSDKELVLEIKDGYSYGQFLDKKISEIKPVVDSTTSENIQMLRKIHLNRADYLFITPEEADSLIKLSGLPVDDFKYINFSNVPKGEKRYIIFSKNVDDATIEKINGFLGT